MRNRLFAKIEKYKEKYDAEICSLKQQFFDTQVKLIEKENIISIILRLLSEQECWFVSTNFNQRLINSTSIWKNITKASSLVGKDDIQNTQYLKKIKTLEEKIKIIKENYFELLENFKNLKEINLKTTEDWGREARRARELKTEIIELKELHKNDNYVRYFYYCISA